VFHQMFEVSHMEPLISTIHDIFKKNEKTLLLVTLSSPFYFVFSC